MEDIRIVEGTEITTKTILDFLNSTKDSLWVCTDQHGLSVATSIKEIRNAMLSLSNRKVHCRLITEITSENLNFCKELMKIFEDIFLI